MSRRWRGRAAAGLAVVLAASATLAVAASAQALPQARALAIPPTGNPPETDIASIHAEGAPDEGSVAFTIQLRSPVVDHEAGYRLSVVVGDPLGARTRASMEMVDGRPTGRLETFEGGGWRQLGTTVADFDAATGRASVVMPIESVPAEAAIRGEASYDSGAGPVASFTRWFSAFALLGQPDQPVVPGSSWANPLGPDGAAIDQSVRLPAAGPWSSVVNQALIVGTTAAPPAELLGAPVVGDLVFVRIASSFEKATGPADFILMDRVTGEVKLMRGTEAGPTDVSGDRSWVGFGLPADNPGAPTSSSFDLERIGVALGQRFDPETTSVAVDEAFVLADGRQVTTSGVAATLGWFTTVEETSVAPSEPEAAARRTEVDPPAEERDVTPVIAGGVVVALLLALVVVLGVRRAPAAEPVTAAGAASGPTPAPAPSPATEPARARRGDEEETERPPREPAAPAAGRRARGHSPDDALAALDAEFEQLSSRMTRRH